MGIAMNALGMGLLLLVVSGACGSASAYELATHARVTLAAFYQSILAQDVAAFQRLGLEAGGNSVLGDMYFDVFGSTERARIAFPYDSNQDKMPGVQNDFQIPFRVIGWLMRGAVREDDSGAHAEAVNRWIFRAEPEPLDDPYGNFNRWCNHFFDPYNNRQLTVGGVAGAVCSGDTFASAPIWATGVLGPFANPLSTAENASRRNHFTVLDAREAMWRALTGYDRALTTKVASGETARRGYWATAFRALGDVLHLNQDMGQPQHTRNEDHGLGHAAWYEKYVDGRAKGLSEITYDFRFGTLRATSLQPLTYAGYVKPSFNSYADYWSTGTGSATMTGRGLADYSSRGFLTPAKGIGNGEYPSPSPNPLAYEAELVTYANGWRGEYLKASVADNYLGAPSGPIRMVRRSVWDDALQAPGVLTPGPLYSFDTATYDDRATLLIPRAVAYSAGLLDYFFRGKLEISLPDAGFYGIVDHSQFAPGQPNHPTDVAQGFKGFGKIKLKLRNTTDAIVPPGGAPMPQDMPLGTLVAVLKFHRNLCYDDLLAGWPTTDAQARECRSGTEEVVVSNPRPNQRVPFATQDRPNGDELTFDLPAGRQLPINAWDVALQVVYRGKLGAEDDAVVVATKDIAEPTFASFMNTTDHVMLNGNFYKPAALATQQALFDLVQPSCRKGAPGNYSVSEACYNVSDNFTFTAGASNVSIAAVADTIVPPRRFARLALLADSGTPARLSWQTGAVSCWVFLADPLTLLPYRAQMDAQGGWFYGRPSSVRTVKGWDVELCYSDIGITWTPLESFRFEQLDALQAPAETSPTPLTIAGWD